MADPAEPGEGADPAPDEGSSPRPPFPEDAARAVVTAAAEAAGCGADEVDIGSPRRLSGGASRITWLVEPTCAGDPTRMIMQMERTGSSGANLAMSTQVDLLRSAAGAGVPVPRVLGSGGEPGSAFVVLEWLPGESVVRRIMRDDSLSASRSRLARDAGRALAAVHRMDPAEHPGLAAGDPLEQMRSLLRMLGEPHPAFEIGLAWLEAHRPPEREAVVVHGDYRMGNLLVSPDGVTGVLDWELAHLGSPVEDLGWFCCRAWRFGSPLRAGGVGEVGELLEGYRDGGGTPPEPEELDWWEAYGTLRWGLICVLQASVHLRGLHRSVELAAIGRRAAQCEEDLLALVAGPSDYEPPAAAEPEAGQHGAGEPAVGRPGSGDVHDRPTAAELLEAVAESLGGLRPSLSGSAAFEARVARNVVDLVRREVLLGDEISSRHRARMALLGVSGTEELASSLRERDWAQVDGPVIDVVRAQVRDKLAVSSPGYWRGDR